jgi:hypothetical protein
MKPWIARAADILVACSNVSRRVVPGVRRERNGQREEGATVERHGSFCESNPKERGMSESTAQHQSDERQVEPIIASDANVVTPGSDHLALDEQIRMRAYEIYRQRGDGIGDDMNDWLRAESECRARCDGAGRNPFDEQRAPVSVAPEDRA